MKHFIRLLTVMSLIALSGCGLFHRVREVKVLNPISFGLTNAKTGTDRYRVLLMTHQEAIRMGVGVSYAGIKEIDLELPAGAASIPLSEYTDFAGVTMTVVNNDKNRYLFTMETKGKTLNVSAQDIDCGVFTDVPELRNGRFILTVRDKNPWVENRIGYDYRHYRNDVFLITNGRGDGLPIMPYNNKNSSPECTYTPCSKKQKVIKNLHVIRSSKSSQITKLLIVSLQDNVLICNVKIDTDNSKNFYGDAAISIHNSTNVVLENIFARGSYSRMDKYGYVFEMNNVANLKVRNVDAFANWGVFGNNNMRNATLENCTLNRFDIHCYGRDVTCKGCFFSGLYNQFSSTYGTVLFEQCKFSSFVPYWNAGSYNTYVPVDVEFKKCEFNLDAKHNNIIKLTGLTDDINPRPELKEKCLPNVRMTGCSVNLSEGLSTWYVINPDVVKYKKDFGHISEIKLEKVTSNAPETAMKVFKGEVKTAKQVKIRTRITQLSDNE